MLPLLHYFADADLGNLKAEEDSVYVNIPLVKFIHYPFSWILPLLILAAILFIVILLYGKFNDTLHLKEFLLGFLPFLASLICSGLLGYFGWQLIELLYPQYNEIQHGFKYNGHWYIIAFVFLSLSISFMFYRGFSKRASVVNLLGAPLFFWLVINTLVFIYLKGAGFFIIPLFFGLFSWFILIKWPKVSYIGMALLAAPALFLFAPLIQFFPVGLGSDHVFISAIFTVLVFGLLLPVVGYYRKKNMLAGLFGILTIVILIISHFKSDFNETRNKPNSLVLYKDATTNNSYYLTYDKILDDWTKLYVGNSPKTVPDNIENAPGSKYFGSYTFAANAPNHELAPSILTVNKDSVIAGFRTIDITLQPQRDIHQLLLYASMETPFKSFNLNGIEVTETDARGKKFYNRTSELLLRYFVSDNDSLRIKYSFPENSPSPEIKVLEYGFDLTTNPRFNIQPRSNTMTPKPFINTDATVLDYIFTIEKQELDATTSINSQY